MSISLGFLDSVSWFSITKIRSRSFFSVNSSSDLLTVDGSAAAGVFGTSKIEDEYFLSIDLFSYPRVSSYCLALGDVLRGEERLGLNSFTLLTIESILISISLNSCV